MSVHRGGDDGGEQYDYVQGSVGTADGENKAEKIDLPINTSDNELFLVESVDLYEANGRLGAGQERTIQAAVSTYGDTDALAAEGPTDFEAGSAGGSILWLQALYHHFSVDEGIVINQTWDPLKGSANVHYPYGHLYLNLENLDSVSGDTTAETGYTIAGQKVEVGNDTMTELLRSIPDPRRF